MNDKLNIKVKIISICLALFSLQAVAKDTATDYLNEEWAEDTWVVSVLEGDEFPNVIASVNGNVIHGNRLNIRIVARDLETCDYGNTLTSLHSMVENENFYTIKDAYLTAVFKGQNIYVQAMHPRKHAMLLGYNVSLEMGWNKIDDIIDFFNGTKEVSLKLIDGNNIKISEYFDIPENSFSLNGLNDALIRAKNECRRIVKVNL